MVTTWGNKEEKEIMQGTMSGARRRGRLRTAWMDNIKTWTGLSVEESIRMTEDRDKWRKYVHGVANRRIEDGYRIEQNFWLIHQTSPYSLLRSLDTQYSGEAVLLWPARSGLELVTRLPARCVISYQKFIVRALLREPRSWVHYKSQPNAKTPRKTQKSINVKSSTKIVWSWSTFKKQMRIFARKLKWQFSPGLKTFLVLLAYTAH